MSANSLKKSHIVRRKEHLDEIFSKGDSVIEFPIRAIFVETNSEAKTLFSVPKKNIRKAVNRNLVRRRIKEAWRVQKLENINVALIYLAKQTLDFKTIDDAIKNIIEKINNRSNAITG